MDIDKHRILVECRSKAVNTMRSLPKLLSGTLRKNLDIKIDRKDLVVGFCYYNTHWNIIYTNYGGGCGDYGWAIQRHKTYEPWIEVYNEKEFMSIIETVARKQVMKDIETIYVRGSIY